MKKVSEEEKQIWIKRYLTGETCRSISKDYPMYNENTISRHIRQAGISRGKGRIKAKDDIKPIVIKEYTDDKYATCASLGRKYNLSDRTIATWLKQNNIPIKQPSGGVITHCDSRYFEKIDTPHKAYLLGFITADGAVVGNSCSIEVHEDDVDIILFAQQQINPQATITTCHYGKKRNKRIAFNSKQLCEDLSKYGVIQNKSKTIDHVPTNQIPKSLLCFYFRGLIDGDGCVHKNGGISIYSGSKLFIQAVQQTLIQEVGLRQLGLYHGTSWFITWTSREDREKLFHYLYDQLDDTFYYKRKYARLYNSLYDNTEVSG